MQCVWGQNNVKGYWQSWSPNLTPPDYYVWGAMKGTVYKDSSHTLLVLKETIRNLIRNIPPVELLHVYANKIRHVGACLQARGDHLHLL